MGSSSRLLTTDSYVVDPIFFPGGNTATGIMERQRSGCMSGARPLYLWPASFWKRLSDEDLRCILASMPGRGGAGGDRGS